MQILLFLLRRQFCFRLSEEKKKKLVHIKCPCPNPQLDRQIAIYSGVLPLRLLLHPCGLPRAEIGAAPLFSPRVGVVDVEEGSLGGELCIY